MTVEVALIEDGYVYSTSKQSKRYHVVNLGWTKIRTTWSRREQSILWVLDIYTACGDRHTRYSDVEHKRFSADNWTLVNDPKDLPEHLTACQRCADEWARMKRPQDKRQWLAAIEKFDWRRFRH